MSTWEREKADIMFVLEMRAKRRARIKNARNKLEKLKAHTHNFVEWLLADLPSKYGTNWVRLFLFSLLIIIGNAVPYTLWSAYIEGFPQTSNYLVRFANALYYSLVTFTTLGYGDMHPTGWLKALSALEALTGAVFMALIVAVIARKWMR
ncbi:potassium channel family protein [Thermococcus sp.]|uniref:potassium channel family protein n=1 Tax=Thermococcus sp. TaxID=35749 RepID=UPI0026295C45|nr:potassium channel family protein [Thermococcus sp.]